MAIDPTALNELGGLARQVLNETSIGGNTAERVGTALVDAHTCLVGANDMSDDIEALQSSVSTLDMSMHGVQSNISTLSNNISELRSTCSTLEGEISQLQSGGFQILPFSEYLEDDITITLGSLASPTAYAHIIWSVQHNCFLIRNNESLMEGVNDKFYSVWSATRYIPASTVYNAVCTEGAANQSAWFYYTAGGYFYYWTGSTINELGAHE